MEETFQILYDAYHQDLYQFLFYMVKDKSQAEDLTQEVYIRVLNSYHTFEGRSSEKHGCCPSHAMWRLTGSASSRRSDSVLWVRLIGIHKMSEISICFRTNSPYSMKMSGKFIPRLIIAPLIKELLLS